MQALFLGIGAIQVVLGGLLAAGRVPPNRLVGYRTVRTLADPEIWYQVNAWLGGALVVSGVLGVVGTLLVFSLVPTERATGLAGAIVGTAALLAVAVASLG